MSSYRLPGVYREEVAPGRPATLPTGVCAFIGAAKAGPLYEPRALQRPQEFAAAFGEAAPGSHLAEAVAGCFASGGRRCYVVRADLGAADWLARALRAVEPLDDADLLAAPDLALAPAHQHAPLQRAMVEHCERHGGRLAILDTPPGATPAEALARRGLFDSRAGALYYPWVVTAGGRAAPPCGHVAGVYARLDRESGVFRAPANQELAGVVDLAPPLAPADELRLSEAGVNLLRALPGRGIRIWGARTLAGARNAGWEQVGVTRLFLTVGRWAELALAGAAFEPNDVGLWVRVRRELSGYLGELWRGGALAGATPEAAFYVKCDAETNPPAVREAGLLVAEVGLAPLAPSEFVIVRLVRREGRAALA